MIGQKKLIEKINNLTIDNFTCPILFIGPFGCGKHTLAKYAADHLEMELVNVDEISSDIILEYKQSLIKKLYFIDLSAFSEKQQNQFLKFIEEPGRNVYIILSAESELTVLETILNRCIKYKFEEYSIEELQQITGSKIDLAYKVFKTPGQILSIDSDQLKSLFNMCAYINNNYYLEKLSTAQLLRCALKINFKEEYNKFDFYNFFTVLLYVAFTDYINNATQTSLDLYLFIQRYLTDLQYKSISKECFIDKFFIELKESVS